MKKGFTLSEVLIVLVIIGVLTAILMPVAFQSSPDENVMKFKKATSTIIAVIRELVNSDKYFSNGDLGLRYDGTLIDNDGCYFMNAFTDIITVKEKHCALEDMYGSSIVTRGRLNGASDVYDIRVKLDEWCQELNRAVYISDAYYYFKTPDNVLFYGKAIPYGTNFNGKFKREDMEFLVYKDANGFNQTYGYICYDVDGAPEGASKEDCINECPFGIAFRVDGKILLSKRAQEWQNKTLQKGNE